MMKIVNRLKAISNFFVLFVENRLFTEKKEQKKEKRNKIYSIFEMCLNIQNLCGKMSDDI